MRASARRWVVIAALCAVAGCRDAGETYVVPEAPLPPNTVMLSEMMRGLSATPGFTDALLARMNEGGKRGPSLLTPALMKRLRELILGKDWQGLDRFSGWTMKVISPAVNVVAGVVGKDDKGELQAGTSVAVSAEQMKGFIDLGPFALDKAETVDLNEPSKLPGFATEGVVTELGAGVTHGDEANPELAPLHAESQRLADVLNRVSLNGMDGAGAFRVGGLSEVSEATSSRPSRSSARASDRSSRQPAVEKVKTFSLTPEDVIRDLQATGHTVVVADARYFANFGHFHYKGQDVMMPFWVNSQIEIPGTGQGLGKPRPLLVPVSHAEYEWKVRGPKINADVSYYFGIDGKAEFRTMDTLDQPWLMGRHAHEYQGADAVEVTRLAGRMLLAYVHQHIARPGLPFGGYYALGVCQDGVAAIEKKMTGAATLFPNTADSSLFDDPRDAEVNTLITAIPKDREGKPPEPERVFGSLPTADVATVSIPGFASDLEAVQAAWKNGHVEYEPGPYHWLVVQAEMLGAGAVLALGAIFVRRRMKAA